MGMRSLPRVEATHLVIALQPAVHDGSIALFRNAFLCNRRVNPVGKSPHVGSDLAKLNLPRCVVSNGFLEVVVEVAVVEEDVGVVVPSVEVAFDRLDRLDNTVNLLVSGKDNEGSIGTGLGRIGLGTAFDEDLVVLFADFSVIADLSVNWRRKSIGGDLPHSWGSSPGYQEPCRRARVANEKNEYQDEHQHGEEDDNPQRHRNGRVPP